MFACARQPGWAPGARPSSRRTGPPAPWRRALGVPLPHPPLASAIEPPPATAAGRAPQDQAPWPGPAGPLRGPRPAGSQPAALGPSAATQPAPRACAPRAPRRLRAPCAPLLPVAPPSIDPLVGPGLPSQHHLPRASRPLHVAVPPRRGTGHAPGPRRLRRGAEPSAARRRARVSAPAAPPLSRVWFEPQRWALRPTLGPQSILPGPGRRSSARTRACSCNTEAPRPPHRHRRRFHCCHEPPQQPPHSALSPKNGPIAHGFR
jgi:hypothetical protein